MPLLAPKTTTVVVPVFNHFDYAGAAVESLLEAPEVSVVIVDDCSPDLWTPAGEAFITHYARRERVKVVLLEVNRGLNYAWNIGIQTALETFHPQQIAVTNSDVLFPRDWLRSVTWALDAGLSLVGPLTNAPGAENAQHVSTYAKAFNPSDQLSRINELNAELLQTQGALQLQTPINGFCMVARAQTWIENQVGPNQFFSPRNEFNSKGQPNPTPLMTLNEYELQKRLGQKGLRCGVALGSYVFHYRSVNRGEQFGRGQAVRKKTFPQLQSECRALAARGRRDEAIALAQDFVRKHPQETPAYHLWAGLELPGKGYLEYLRLAHRDYRPRGYFEIGVQQGASFSLSKAPTRALGVDPSPQPQLLTQLLAHQRILSCTSSTFFERYDLEEELGAPLDLAFIDGDHRFEQVLKDFMAVERYSHPGTVVFLHDCYPLSAQTSTPERTTRFWTGDVWRAAWCLRQYRPDLTWQTLAVPPSGLAWVRGLNPHSTPALHFQENFSRICAEAAALTFDEFKAQAPTILEMIRPPQSFSAAPLHQERGSVSPSV